MSTYLGSASYLVELGSSIADAYATIKAELTSRGYQFFGEGTGATYSGYFIPPATEEVGNSYMREVCKMTVSGTQILFQPANQSLVMMPQVCRLWEKTAGNVRAGVRIGGVLVQQDPATMNAANTAAQNLRHLYTALRESVDPAVTQFSYEFLYPARQNADETNCCIIAQRKVPAADVTWVPNANTNGGILANSKSARIQNECPIPAGHSLSIDLVSGFVYYMQICSRGIAIATKTNTAFYGPIHIVWSNRASALANMPQGTDPRWVTPIELFVGYDDAASETDSHATPAKAWGLPVAFYSNAVGGSWDGGHPISRHGIRHKMMDLGNYTGYGLDLDLDLLGSAMFTWTDNVDNDFQAHRVSSPGFKSGIYTTFGGGGGTNIVEATTPPCITDDWYKFTGTATDESLLLVADTVIKTSLVSNIPAGSNPATIEVADASAMKPSGNFVVGNEAFEYTGKSGNVLTGVTRSKYGTTAVSHFSGDSVAQGMWFVKINGGLLFFGYNRPSA